MMAVLQMMAVEERDGVLVTLWIVGLLTLASATANLDGAESPNLYVRLAGGSESYGRIEVKMNSTDPWGTVCDDDFTDEAAAVVCGMLNFNIGKMDSSHSGGGTGDILLDNVVCEGKEESLTSCSHNTFGQHDCTHPEDVWVLCGYDENDVSVRLSSGNSTSGVVEVKFWDTAWGRVCSSGWDHRDAIVVCRMLGFHDGLAFTIASNTSHAIHMDGVDCVDQEKTLVDCAHSTMEQHCDSSHVAAVTCINSYDEVRLAKGNNSSGRVEVRSGTSPEWGTVCDDGWDDRDASVVCRMLGFSWGKAEGGELFGSGSGAINMDEVHCVGNEKSLFACGHLGWGVHNCKHNEDAGVRCANNHVIELSVRLANGNSTSGRVEVRPAASNEWGTVCSRGWDHLDAAVVCRMLGFRAGKTDSAHVNPGQGMIYLNDVQCSGSETSLAECASTRQVQACGHSEDVTVSCSHENQDLQVRLAGGGSTYGRVEVRNSTLLPWGSVCDDKWDDSDATVVCNMLGFDAGKVVTCHAGEALVSGMFGSGSGPFYLDEVQCGGGESSLGVCSHSGWGTHDCLHLEDASVACIYQTGAVVRLAEGNNSSGRVEVRSGTSPEWGTVCDDDWDDRDASVVCRMLGFSWGKATPSSVFGPGSGSIHMDGVQCAGSETTLLDCAYSGWSIHNCVHWEDAGVQCIMEDFIAKPA